MNEYKDEYRVLSITTRTMDRDIDVLNLDPRLSGIAHKVNYENPKAAVLAKAIRAGWVNVANELSEFFYNAIVSDKEIVSELIEEAEAVEAKREARRIVADKISRSRFYTKHGCYLPSHNKKVKRLF